MADNNTTTNTTANQTITQFDIEKLRRVEELLDNMKEDAEKAEHEKDTFMLSVYQSLLKVASPIVIKAHARVERESNARINNARKELMAKEREARKAEREAKRKARESSNA